MLDIRTIAISAAELVRKDFPEIKWVVQDLMAPGATVLAGAPKAGKSILALQLSKAVGEGSEFLGHKVRKGRVLYIALEDGDTRLRHRTLTQEWGELHTVMFLHQGTLKPFLRKHDLTMSEFLLSELDWSEWDLIIIDPLNRWVNLERTKYDTNDGNDMTRLISPIHEKALNTDTAVLIIGHHGKAIRRDGHSRDPIGDILGATAISSVTDSSWGFYRDPEKGTGTLMTRGRDGEDQVISLKIDSEMLRWEVTFTEEAPVEAPTVTLTDKDREYLEFTSGGWFTKYEISKALKRSPGAVYKQTNKLLSAGLLAERDGKYTSNPGPETQVPEPEESTREETSVEVSLVEAPETQVPVVPQAGDPVPAETKPETIPPEPEPELEMEVKMIDHSAVKDVEKICAEMTDKYPANAWDIYVAIRDLGPLTLEEIEDVTGESRFYIGYICLQLTQKGILLRGQYVDEFWGPVPEDPADLPAAREAMGRKWQELELAKRRKDVQQTNEKFRGQTWYSEVSLPTNTLPYPENFVVSSW